MNRPFHCYAKKYSSMNFALSQILQPKKKITYYKFPQKEQKSSTATHPKPSHSFAVVHTSHAAAQLNKALSQNLSPPVQQWSVLPYITYSQINEKVKGIKMFDSS